MPVKRTSGYQLSQWEKSDKVLMDDFNTDNLNLENALAGLESSKAKQSDLTALKTEVSAKAASSALTALQNTVNTKANQSDLTALSQKVDQLSAALTSAKATIPQIKIGTYQGDNSKNRVINVGFTPKAVFVFDNNGATNYFSGTRYVYRGGLAVTDGPVNTAAASVNSLTITANGFIVTNDSYSPGNTTIFSDSNTSGTSYRYVAIA